MENSKGKMAASLIDDRDIIDLYFKRDEKAIEHTDKKYKKHLMVVGNNILNNYEDSEECVSDTYIRTWNSIPPTNPISLRGFLTVIMRRLSINKYHSNQRHLTMSSNLTVSLSEIEDFVEDSFEENEMDTYMLGRIISDFIRSLDSRDRYIFMSRYYAAKTIDNIAKALGVSRSTVNKRLAYIREGLKEKLREEGDIL